MDGIICNIFIFIPINGVEQMNINMQSIIISTKTDNPESSHNNYQVDSA
jgi:hypothetical protein